jgi:hydroxyethylthiazole kinase-like uncharacterized protein yjeF
MQPSPRVEHVDEAWLVAHPLPDLTNGDKYDRGTVAIVGGGAETPGAVLLAGRAALRMGAGRVRVATARSVAAALGVALPEAKVAALGDDDAGGLLPDRAALAAIVEGAGTVLIGPGAPASTIGSVVDTVVAVADRRCTVVLDAAAIAALGGAGGPTAAALRDRLVLTPNHGEVAAAVGHDREGGAAELAARFRAVVTCFGRIDCPDGRALVVDGDGSALGTSGSGDVLAGLVAGAASRCPDDPCLAALWGTVAHTEAGRRLQASRRYGAYLASELVAAVGSP